MRALFLSMLLLAAHGANGCDCFPPELQMKTARDALQQARLAVYGRVVEVSASGKAKVLVLESFKGPPAQSTIEAELDPAQCPAARFTLGEEALVLSFQDTVTACDKRAPDHYLVPVFRTIAAKG
ncbi:MAG TPA: hypothetical protein VFK10_12190 [Burkholderiaceae bacterium]|nr:hypothetical protein [Burkholderiaceae bacterium]